MVQVGGMSTGSGGMSGAGLENVKLPRGKTRLREHYWSRNKKDSEVWPGAWSWTRRDEVTWERVDGELRRELPRELEKSRPTPTASTIRTNFFVNLPETSGTIRPATTKILHSLFVVFYLTFSPIFFLPHPFTRFLSIAQFSRFICTHFSPSLIIVLNDENVRSNNEWSKIIWQVPISYVHNEEGRLKILT